MNDFPQKCGKEFIVIEREKEYPKKAKYFCSRSCANSRPKTEESRKKTSESLKKYAREHGFTKKVTLLETDRICEYCGNIFHSEKQHQRFCSVKCMAKNRGLKNFLTKAQILDIPEEKIKLFYDVYKKQCHFNFDIYDYKKEYDFCLILEYGWYKPKNKGDNLFGVSKDHCFSVKRGFLEKIDPYFISHPANCKLILQSENASKGEDCSITQEELYKRVDDWNQKYGIYENTIDYRILKEMGIFPLMNKQAQTTE